MKNLGDKLELLSLQIEKNNTKFFIVLGFGEAGEWQTSYGDPHETELRVSEELIEKLEANQLRQQEVLAQVYDKVPESAQEGVLNAMEKSAKGLQNAMENMQKSDEAKVFKTKLKNTIENFGTTKKNEIKEKLIEKGVISNGEVIEDDITDVEETVEVEVEESVIIED